MIIVTTNEIPGYRIEAVFGEVMGMTVRSANIVGNFTAGFKAIGGGEIHEYTKIVYESRNEVMNRMWEDAIKRGANAIIGMRFDNGDIGTSFTEVCAYGTAVFAVPIPAGEDGSTPQSAHLAAQPKAPQPQAQQAPQPQAQQAPPPQPGPASPGM